MRGWWAAPGALLLCVLGCMPAATDDGPADALPRPVRLGAIPADAEWIAHENQQLIALDRSGRETTQLTFGPKRSYEHAALSYDGRFIVANEQLPNPKALPGGFSRLWLFDLEQGTETRLLPHFVTAGNGGVDWDAQGFIYFAAKEQDVFPRPASPPEFLDNAGANDVYRVKPDGSQLQRLTNTPRFGEADVSVSDDSTLVAYNGVVLDPAHTTIELWVAGTDGSNPRRVLATGTPGRDSAHDPELSPDNRSLVFSRVNADVPPNFPKLPAANTAHDIWACDLNGSNLRRLTAPGPISIAPDWAGEDIVYLELNERDMYLGVSMVSARGTDQPPTRLRHGPNMAKWIPSAR